MMSRFLIGTSLLCGVVIISRPPALFPVNDNDTKNATNKNETSDRKLVTGSHHVKVDNSKIGHLIMLTFIIRKHMTWWDWDLHLQFHFYQAGFPSSQGKKE